MRPPPGPSQKSLRWLSRESLLAQKQHWRLDRLKGGRGVQYPLGPRADSLAEPPHQRLADLPREPKAETLRHSKMREAEDLNSPPDSIARDSQEIEPKNLSEEMASVAN